MRCVDGQASFSRRNADVQHQHTNTSVFVCSDAVVQSLSEEVEDLKKCKEEAKKGKSEVQVRDTIQHDCFKGHVHLALISGAPAPPCPGGYT